MLLCSTELIMADALTTVICFDHASITGGQAKVAFDSAVGLKRAGHRPIIFAAAGPVSSQLADAGIETVCLDQKDLVGNPSKIAAAVQGVYTIHEYFQFCPNGGFYNYQARHICKLKPLSTACWTTNCDSRNYARKVWRNVRLTAAKHIAHLPEVFADYIAISDFQESIVAPLLPNAARLHRIDNPVTVPNLGPKPDPTAGDIVFVGRLSPEKGAFLFAEAARRVGIRPVYVGDGPIAGEIARRFPEARLLGWHDTRGVQAAMRGARALVFPSLWYEGQPLTVLEAKALGVPVIVSDACAGREEVADGITGLWFKSADAEDLARAISVLQADAVVSSMSRAAHQAFWASPPTLDRHIESILSVYRNMLQRQRRTLVPVAGAAEDDVSVRWAARTLG